MLVSWLLSFLFPWESFTDSWLRAIHVSSWLLGSSFLSPENIYARTVFKVLSHEFVLTNAEPRDRETEKLEQLRNF